MVALTTYDFCCLIFLQCVVAFFLAFSFSLSVVCSMLICNLLLPHIIYALHDDNTSVHCIVFQYYVYGKTFWIFQTLLLLLQLCCCYCCYRSNYYFFVCHSMAMYLCSTVYATIFSQLILLQLLVCAALSLFSAENYSSLFLSLHLLADFYVRYLCLILNL